MSAELAEDGLDSGAVDTPLVAETIDEDGDSQSDGAQGIPRSDEAGIAEPARPGSASRERRGGARSHAAVGGRGAPRRRGSRQLGGAAPRWRQAAAREAAHGGTGAIHLFIRALPRGSKSLRKGPQNLAGFLRDTILTAVYTGRLTTGDRLPSIRELAVVLGVAKRDVEAAYGLLNRWGITTPRDRSGMYVAALSPQQEAPGSETATWVAQVLDGACEHQVRIPYLPELLRRWTNGENLRCACIESDRDSLETLRAEIERNFGVTAVGIDAADLPEPEGDPAGPAFSGGLNDADLWVTSPLFAPTVRGWADRLRKPLVLATLQPRIVRAIEEHLAHSRLLVVCTDARFGERIRTLFGRAAVNSGIEVVLASDTERVGAIPPTEPVLLTWPAREALKRPNLRLLAPVSPAYGEDFARNLVRLLLRFNLGPR